MFPFRRLEIWKRSHQAALRTYQLTRSFPPGERFGLTAQLRRAAFSVPANIAEGSKRLTQREFARFVNIAEGSAAEAGYIFELAGDLEMLRRDQAALSVADYDEVSRMLFAFRTKLLSRGR